MSLSGDLAGVLARDPRYSIEAYAFVFEALEYSRSARRRARENVRNRVKGSNKSRHVTGRELCEGARCLLLDRYGFLALEVLSNWGIRSTFDIGEIVYNLIDAGDLEKMPSDTRTDFDGVYEFEQAFRLGFAVPLDEIP